MIKKCMMKDNLLLPKDLLGLSKIKSKNISLQFQNIYIYIDKLYDIVDKYDNTYHRTIKMKSTVVKTIIYTEENNDKISNLKLVNTYECQNIKTFLQKVTLQLGQKKLL